MTTKQILRYFSFFTAFVCVKVVIFSSARVRCRLGTNQLRMMLERARELAAAAAATRNATSDDFDFLSEMLHFGFLMPRACAGRFSVFWSLDQEFFSVCACAVCVVRAFGLKQKFGCCL